jgi:hypothetical protein
MYGMACASVGSRTTEGWSRAGRILSPLSSVLIVQWSGRTKVKQALVLSRFISYPESMGPIPAVF